MAKSLSKILADKKLEGIKSSSKNAGSTGDKPGVDYHPNKAAQSDTDFIKDHEVEKHADRVGNKDDVYKGKTKYSMDNEKQSRHGYKRGEDEKQYGKFNEAKVPDTWGKGVEDDKDLDNNKNNDTKDSQSDKERRKNVVKGRLKSLGHKVIDDKTVKESKCNMSEAGTKCDVHGDDECPGYEKSGKKKLLLGGKKTLKEILKTVREGAKVDRMVSHIKASEKAAGKSDKKAESIAWATANKRGYLDNKNKKMEESTGMYPSIPMLEGGKSKTKKIKKESAPADTPITMKYGASPSTDGMDGKI